MPWISFSPQKKSITLKSFEVSREQNLMNVLLEQKIPVASSCHGEGVCGKCKIQILAGLENTSPATDLEVQLKIKNNYQENERAACQVKIRGDLCVDTKYW